jgi:Astacin (Peptidase family M12A)
MKNRAGALGVAALISIALSLVLEHANVRAAEELDLGLHGPPPTTHGLVERDGIWPQLTIPVCWKASIDGFNDEKTWVRKAIHHTIEVASAYRLTRADGSDWPICQPGLRAEVQIVVVDQVPNSNVGLQTRTDKVTRVRRASPTEMDVNFLFKEQFQNCASPAKYRENCIKVIAVHEAMHALGVLHEQYNTNLKVINHDCYLKLRGMFKNDYHGTNVWPVTSYDPDSIMNYCREIYLQPPTLSSLDVTTLKAMEARSHAH